MAEPEQPEIGKLTAAVDRLVQMLAGRQQELRFVRTAVERIDARVSGFMGAITALREETNQNTAAVETLTREQARLSVLMTQIEQRVEDRDQPQGMIQHALERVSELGERVRGLEQAKGGTPPSFAGVPAEPIRPPEPQIAAGRPRFETAGGGAPPPGAPPGQATPEPEPQDLADRVTRLEWKQQTLSRIVQQIVDRLIG